MRDALGRMFAEDGEKTVPGNPRVIFALANHAHSGGWDRAKVLQRADVPGGSRQRPGR